MGAAVQPAHVFVYGTLKRGECRHRMWPRPPKSVEPAWVCGALFDLGPYPALAPGSGRVLGEMWLFDPPDMHSTLQALDAIEGFNQGGRDLYTRQIVRCQKLSGGSCPAYTYFYAAVHELEDHQQLAPGADGYIQWTG